MNTSQSSLSHGGNGSGIQSVLIVDPERLTRAALQQLISTVGPYRVVAEADNAEEGLSRLSTVQPMLLILEIELPGKSGIEMLYEMKRKQVAQKTLVLTRLRSEKMMRFAFNGGALGYLFKTSEVNELRAALAAVSENRKYLPPDFGHLVEEFSKPLGHDLSLQKMDPLDALSSREREIFHLLADGQQNAGIAKKLFISPRTVETHRARIVRKLGIHSNAELIRYAIRHGLATI